MSKDAISINSFVAEIKKNNVKKINEYKWRAKNKIAVGDPSLLAITAANWLSCYQQNNPLTTFSFLINATSLTNYLRANMGVVNLHFILSYDNLGNTDFVAIGTDNQLNHIYTDRNNPMVYSNFYVSPFCGVKYDALDPQYPNVNRYKFLAPGDNSPMDVQTALGNIADYEIPNFPQVNTFSFLIDAANLRNFLTTAASQIPQPQPAANVPFLQVYFAYQNNNLNSMTIIIVGVDGNGNHIYWNRDQNGTKYVFEQAVPCPECNVQYDAILPIPVQQISN